MSRRPPQHPAVALVGPYPPPVGGVSVHVARLAERLHECGITPIVYAQHIASGKQPAWVHPARIRLSWRRWLIGVGWRCPGSVVHFHMGLGWVIPAAVMRCLGKSVVMTVHAASHVSCSAMDRWAIRMLLGGSRVGWIAVNSSIAGALVELGASPRQVYVIPAYLRSSGVDDERQTLPPPAADFLADGSPRLVSYAWKRRPRLGPQDDYGLDLCIDALPSILDGFPDAKLLICISDAHEEAYAGELEERARAHGVADRVHIALGPLGSGETLWRAADVYLRATRTDGDSLAVREALAVGCRVVASDAAPRPRGAALFAAGSAESLAAVTKRRLGPQGLSCSSGTEDTDFFEDVLAVYRTVQRK